MNRFIVEKKYSSNCCKILCDFKNVIEMMREYNVGILIREKIFI